MHRSPAQPSHLRRRYQAFQEQKQRNGFRSSSTDASFDGPSGLELSMHLPTEPYRNRFELLTPPSPPPRLIFGQDHRAGPYPRRQRHGRGTREAKRRRDARRNRRKFLAAQELDWQLSRKIDETLTSANIYRPPQLRLPAPKPPAPVPAIRQPQPARMPPTPPQLPFLNFGGLDLMEDFPQLSNLSPRLVSPSRPLLTPQVPSWCPNISSILNKKSCKDDLPLFFDLSSLPEPFQAPKPTATSKCQEVQLYQPKVSARPVKQSRFFPARPSSPRPSVKLAPKACVLHKSDKCVQVDLPRQPRDTSEHAIGMLEPKYDERIEASAANLWRILTTNESDCEHLRTNPYTDSFATNHPQDRLSAPFGMYDTRIEAIGMPVELDSTELPYVHANTLTGQGNERAEYPKREIEEHRTVICDSPRTATPEEEMYVGLNELVVDHEMHDEVVVDHNVYGSEDEQRYWDAEEAFCDLPPLPVTPVELEAALPDAFSIHEATTESPTPSIPAVDTSSHRHEHSSAHFESERDLFAHSPHTPSADQDFIDVASFLELGHVPNCWCRPCQENYDHDFDDQVSGCLEPADEEWTICSSATGTRSPSSCSAWEWEWGTLLEENSPLIGADCAGYSRGETESGCLSPSVKAHGAW